jgi:peptidoglycan/xylan/chitin deacetylase (PgdA/CDA1 family)
LPRLTVALTFDHDAISSEVDRGDGPVLRSRGQFGPRVGVGRVLDVLARESIPATWFVPGHTLVTFPDSVAAIVAGGHELACHAWAHEDLATHPDDERQILERAVEALTRAAGGAPPTGFRAPYWSLGPRTLEHVAELGFRYDSSLMADDVHPYRVAIEERHDRSGSDLGRPGPLVEIPVSWALDDWPHFEPGPRGVGPMSAPSKVLEIWLGELDYAWRHEPDGVLTVTMHPEAIGRGHRLAMLEEFIARARALDGLVFERLDRVVDGWLAGEPPANLTGAPPA